MRHTSQTPLSHENRALAHLVALKFHNPRAPPSDSDIHAMFPTCCMELSVLTALSGKRSLPPLDGRFLSPSDWLRPREEADRSGGRGIRKQQFTTQRICSEHELVG